MKVSTILSALVAASLVAGAGRLNAQVYTATLDGKSASPPVGTDAVGAATITHQDGALRYQLEVGGIEDVTSACIHVAGANPAVVMLYTGPQTGRVTGPLASGTIKADQLSGVTLDELLASMRAGNAYVSVHTVKYPGGEIMGKLHTVKPASRPA